MKKLLSFLSIFSILLAQNVAIALEEITYNDFYNYQANTRSFVFTKNNEYKKNDSYKQAKKINKMYKKNKHGEILSLYPDFVPSLYSFFDESLKEKKYDVALKYLAKIEPLDHSFTNDQMNLFYYFTYYGQKNYSEALKRAKKISLQDDMQLNIASCYLNLKNYDKAIAVASRIDKNDVRYYPAQELIFKAYYRQNNYLKANVVANKLLKLNPDIPDNYIRLAKLEINPEKQLKYYYEARNKADDRLIKFEINNIIIEKEQKKIDDAFKKIKVYLQKPKWLDCVTSTKYGNEQYWQNRQDDFFADTTNCIKNYSGNELSKCFIAVNEKQNKLTEDLEEDIKDERTSKYQDKIVEQNRRMIQQQARSNYYQAGQYYELQQINNKLKY